MESKVDRSFQRDIESLNSRYITYIKDSIGTGTIATNPILKCCPSAIQIIKDTDKIQPLAACNVLQFKIVVNIEPTQESSIPEVQEIIRQTIIFYREVTKTNPHFTQNITGLSMSTANNFAINTYTEINELVQSKRCVIQMRFFDGYWENIQDLVDDSTVNFLLVTATQAANETFRTMRGAKS